ncbi:hypothetical protein BFW87_00915 [Pseudomonas fluorescens]|uniref:Acyltransferase 3 domain-containing protein n=1 Tax=Pseudomonas fluorescens TaxID=294 RepID=A0A1T2Z9I3_PSEFL|nr:acyltransferase [Pseudomonas fluorescens]OPB00996.1 hypothetical protein BFW87_00915 [Pseudomonas fluorescens]
MPEKSIKKYDYIDAVRGLAIILVILVHSSQHVKPDTSWLSAIMNEGASGVQFFYIASAITLCMSWAARKSNELHQVRNFYLRRVFRIAPMFYLAIALFLILNGTKASYFSPNGISWWFVPATALFLHGFHPETINSVVPGGWSVAVEMTFYLVFPFLMCIKKFYYFLILLIMCVFLQQYNAPVSSYIFSYNDNQKYLIDRFAFFNFFSQLPVFIMGIMAYMFLAKNKAVNLKVALLGGVTFLALSVEFWNPHQSFILHHVIAGGMFAIFSIFLAYHPWKIFVNRLTVFLGRLSFSMYLVHIAVLTLLANEKVVAFFGDGDLNSLAFFLLVVSVTACISWFTYKHIEKPGIAAGRKLIDRLEGSRMTKSTPAIPSDPAK